MGKNLGKTSFEDLKVVEIAGDIGGYAGKMFADLGADVIHIEPPEGDPVRKLPPFLHSSLQSDLSLTYLFQNTNKRGIVIDLNMPDGKEVFCRLIADADILLENMPPRKMSALGLGYEALEKINPKLVHVSVTPFGQNGPYRDLLGSDLVCMAMGGMLYLGGTGDDKPALAYGQQAYVMGSLYAASGAAVALLYADSTGEGQFIDISLQDCVSTALETASQDWDLEQVVRRGSSGDEAGRAMYKCKNGLVLLMAAMGTSAKYWDALVSWLEENDVKNADQLRNENWYRPKYRKTQEAHKIFKEIFESFSIKHDAMYLYEEGQLRQVVCYPVNSPKGVFENPHLKSREFFKTLYHEKEKTNVIYPGPPYRFEKIPWQLLHSAPGFGEHTIHILKELNYSTTEIETLMKGGACK